MILSAFRTARSCSRCILRASTQLQAMGVRTAASFSTILKPFQLKKITQDFDHIYDNNGDGFMDKNEVLIFKQRVKEFVEKVQGRTMKHAYSELMDDYFTVVRDLCDADRDGHISRTAWIQMWERIITKAGNGRTLDHLPEFIRIMPAAIFPLIDSREDGVVDTQEYSQFWHHVGGYPEPTDHELERIFHDLTEGGRYKLDLKRVEELYADFYLSNDVNTPGKYISGPIDYGNLVSF